LTERLQRPKRKDPTKRTRLPLLPQAARSRQAQLLTLAAAEGRFELHTCRECGCVHYPPRDACPKCLSEAIAMAPASPYGRVLAETTVRVSPDVYFRERMPWRIGTVLLDVGVSVVAHLHGDVTTGNKVRLAWHLDRSGQAVAFAWPDQETPNMADDLQARELTLDPKFRRVLVTDIRSAVGQACAREFAAAGSTIIFAGLAESWKPFPGLELVRKVPGIEIMTLDVTDADSIIELAAEIGARVDIVVNTAEHVRAGGILERTSITVARDQLESGYLGLMRLAQALAPTMKFRGADGASAACAWVNVLSIFARANWPVFGAFSAAQAAMLSASHALRAELRPSGVRVVNVFTGPLDTEWFQTVPPPKVTPPQVARAIVDALRRGLEDVYVGDVAEDLRMRLAENPKAVERDLASER
jgi:NAD(P)-dependent dehydrogenase (short-subunit alcohol dehydrogenase family)/uncharacterized OB-fold protein